MFKGKETSSRYSFCSCSVIILYPLSGPVYMSSSQYRLLGVDVREESQMEEALSAAGLDWAAPTLILSEVVLTYMDTRWYSRDWDRTAFVEAWGSNAAVCLAGRTLWSAGRPSSCHSPSLWCTSRSTHTILSAASCRSISWSSIQLCMRCSVTQTSLHRDGASWTRPVQTLTHTNCCKSHICYKLECIS